MIIECETHVVYYDQHLAAVHSKHLSKYAFQCFYAKSSKKEKKLMQSLAKKLVF